MKKTYIPKCCLPFAVLMITASCTEDNGNYDYTDIGEVTLEITPDTIVMYGEELTMKPHKAQY